MVTLCTSYPASPSFPCSPERAERPQQLEMYPIMLSSLNFEDVVEEDHCTSLRTLGVDKGLNNSKCLELVDALWRTNGQAVHLFPHCVFHENFVYKSFQ